MRFSAIALSGLLCTMACAAPLDEPKLLNGHDIPECTAALEFAQAAYRSNVPYPNEYQEVPPGLGSDLIETNNPLLEFTSDKVLLTHFELNGKRLVRKRGYMHGYGYDSMILVPASWSYEQLNRAWWHKEFDDISFVVPSSFRGHLVFRRKDSDSVWIVYAGESLDEFLPLWQVHVSIGDRYQEVCQIQFRPPLAHASLLLPPAVRQLDQLIRRSIGIGVWRTGGFNYLSYGDRALANAALRPWAMDREVNSRAKVDAGLLAWSKNVSSHRALYASILRQYPRAEKALAAYYSQHFKMPTDQAQATAKDTLDAAFRSYYSF